ncbi:hypothetical protein GF402_01370 [Candidatus Fermentibacteria bacterium]|nr:hypothetical protein [Candidatus Fermentibacteria bacterium]
MSFSRPLMRLRLRAKQLLGWRLRRNRDNPRIRHDLGVIFIHIPKTGGNSVTRALTGIPKRGESLSPQIGKHAKAEEVRFLLGRKAWDRCFSFALVRNPWDLMVSCYHWWIQKAPQLPYHRRHSRRIARMGSFDRFIRSRYGTGMINERPGDLFDWYTDGRRTIVDYVGRLENIEEDWREICGRAGIPHVEMPHINPSRRGSYVEYYDSGTKELVARRFARTIETFGYEFGDGE